MSAIFLSHSSRDDAATAELRARLMELGHRSFFLDYDPAVGIPAGRSWEKELYSQLRNCRAVIVLCSEASMKSDWVFAEITHARALGKPVFPIVIAPCEVRSLLTDVQVIDWRSDPKTGLERLNRGLEIAGLDPRKSFDWDPKRPPYPGLLALQEEDAAIFFGRDDEIRDGLALLRRVRRFGGARLILVLGASGSGKSSLVRAGLLPRLRRDADAWLVLDPFRPLAAPWREFARVLAGAFAKAGMPRDSEEIAQALEAGTSDERVEALVALAADLRRVAERPEATVLVPIDQLEELWAQGEAGSDAAFVATWQKVLAAADSPFLLLATLRSDFLGELQRHPAGRELAFEPLGVGPMTAADYAEVVEGPAHLAGLELGPGLVRALVADTETDDALPLLAFVLRELWEGYGEDGRLTLEDYRDRLGGLQAAVAHAAETVLAARPLSTAEEADLRSAFVSLVRLDEEGHYARRSAAWDKLAATIHDVLERFVAARLLVVRSEGGERRMEVAHEALLRAWNRLVGWLDEDRAFLLWRKRNEDFRREWERTGHDRAALLRGPACVEARSWLGKRPEALTSAEKSFIRESVLALRRTRRRWIAAALLMLLVMAGIGGVAYQRKVQAVQEQIVFHDSNLLNHARFIRLAMPNEPEESAERLLQLIRPQLYVKSLDVEKLEDEGMLLSHSEDTMLAAVKAQGGVAIRWVFDDTLSVLLPHPATVYKARIQTPYSLDVGIRITARRHVLTAADDGVVRLWELPELEPFFEAVREGHLPSLRNPPEQLAPLAIFSGHRGTISWMRFGPDGRFAATVAGDSFAVWPIAEGSAPLLRGQHADVITAIDFSPDGSQLVTASADDSVQIWDLEEPYVRPQVLKGHKTDLAGVAVGPNGERIISVSRDGEIWRWDRTEDWQGKKLKQLDASCTVDAVRFPPGSARYTTFACQDGTARVLDLEPESGKEPTLAVLQ